MLHEPMMESNEEQDAGVAGVRRFGLGVSAPLEGGHGSTAPAEPVADRQALPSAEGPARRKGSFTCELGRAWPRASAADLDAALRALSRSAGDPLQELSGATAALRQEDLDDLLAFFAEEDSRGAARGHFSCTAPAVRPSDAIPEGDCREDPGTEIEAILLRPHHARSLGETCERLVQLMGCGRPLVVLSDPTLPVLAEAAVNWLLSQAPDAPLCLLHDDGLDVLRAAAARPNLLIELVEPEAGLAAWLPSLRKTRDELVQAQADLAAEQESITEESDGWFGSGVVAQPLAPLRVCSQAPAPWQVPADADPVAAAADIVERAFGPSVLGGFAERALCQVRIPALLFSRVTEELLAQLAVAEDDPAFDPPGWVLERVEPSSVLPRAKRLGLDEGATLIFERRSAREDKKPYGLVFTNGEARMRIGDGARALGVLLLMRGD